MLVTLLTVLFIGPKLIGFIAWSWLWVLSPLWISASFALVMFCLMLFAYLRG